MKRKIFTFFILSLALGFSMLRAQIIFEENFEYSANRPLIIDPVPSSDNLDPVTGWSTIIASTADVNVFSITEAPLVYEGYPLSGIGNALRYNGEKGQSVFKLFQEPVLEDKTVYISFLINFSNIAASGTDYPFSIRMEPAASSVNYGSKLWVSVNPNFPGEEVSIGINKLANSPVWTGENIYFAANKTHLFVIKYYIGKVIGTVAADETGKYDDVMSLYINPPLSVTEPATPTLKHEDPNVRDIYRNLTNGGVFGGAHGLFLRSGTAGTMPPFTIDAIRVGLKWTDVVPLSTGFKEKSVNHFKYHLENNKIVVSNPVLDYRNYELFNIYGQKILSGSLMDINNNIDVSYLTKGIYVLRVQGRKEASAKVLVH